MSNWVKVFDASQVIIAEIVKNMLLENNIQAVVVNKVDSAYLFGIAEVYCKSNDLIAAKQLIELENKNYE